jgi:hypothetical protein
LADDIYGKDPAADDSLRFADVAPSGAVAGERGEPRRDQPRALREFVEVLWNAEIPSGRLRYYDDMW